MVFKWRSDAPPCCQPCDAAVSVVKRGDSYAKLHTQRYRFRGIPTNIDSMKKLFGIAKIQNWFIPSQEHYSIFIYSSEDFHDVLFHFSKPTYQACISVQITSKNLSIGARVLDSDAGPNSVNKVSLPCTWKKVFNLAKSQPFRTADRKAVDAECPVFPLAHICDLIVHLGWGWSRIWL